MIILFIYIIVYFANEMDINKLYKYAYKICIVISNLADSTTLLDR